MPDSSTDREHILGALYRTGADIRIFGPGEDPEKLFWGISRSIRDPALAGWLLGKDLVAQQGVRGETFALWDIPGQHGRGWLVPMTDESSAAILENRPRGPTEVFETLKDAEVVSMHMPDPEHRRLRVLAYRPSILVLSQLADPEWQAVLERNGQTTVCEPLPAFPGPDGGAWQAIRIPEAGEWSVRMVYRGRDVYQGLAISALAWMTFAYIWFRFGRERQGRGQTA
jgi:hypothetical protein